MNIGKYIAIFSVCISLPFNSLLEASCKPCHSRDETFTADYIVVGVGTAGGLMTRKLSNDFKTSVLALHIGENLTDDPLIKLSKNSLITVGAGLIGEPPLYESGETVPQTNANDRLIEWIIALPEGGASSINAGAWCRGTNEVYAQWEAIAGPRWSVSRILEIYKKLEHYHGQTPDPEFRGYKGPLSIIQETPPLKVAQVFTNAIQSGLGVPFVLDYNDPLTPIGVSSQMQYTQKGKDGKFRVSSATAFLGKDIVTPEGVGVDGRQLLILFNSRGLRTIWDHKTAVGVEFDQNGKTKKAFANKGIIVCAGLFSSPFLLHSGIGPKNLLKSLDIPVIFDNPNVGQGLADQPRTTLIFTSDPDDFEETDDGFFAEISWLSNPDGSNPTVRELRFTTLNPVPGITIAAFDLVQPRSRGSVSINSSDPLDPPVIDLGLFTDPGNVDLNLFKSGFVNYITAINTAVSLTPGYTLILPPPAIIGNDTLLTEFIKENVASNMHFQSHCRMAPQDQGGVVDSKGRVYGVKHLYVADDSVVPLCMDGSPMASAYLIAANIAQLIIND